MRKFVFSVFPIFVFFLSSAAQSSFKQFQMLSRPEKCWVISHPFVAMKAIKTTKAVLLTVDSIKKTNIIGIDMNGGKVDAFKHAYWMLSLTDKIGKGRSLKLGKAHEKGNYLEFKKKKLEDKILPDSVSSEMDLRNNRVGAESLKMLKTSNDMLKVILEALNEGRLFIIKKDKQGNYLYCDGTFIDTNVWAGKWNIPKCLIPSDKE